MIVVNNPDGVVNQCISSTGKALICPKCDSPHILKETTPIDDKAAETYERWVGASSWLDCPNCDYKHPIENSEKPEKIQLGIVKGGN